MTTIDINQDLGKHIHLIGIGGISMSAIAEILLNQGYHVSGSDMNDSGIIDKLRAHGVEIFIGHHKNNVQGADLVVYTAAIKDHNPERMAAKEQNIPQIDRAEMLGIIMKNYKKAIAVSGSHGKTTTTSLISLIMEYANLDPTILVGGELDEIGGNIKIGNSEHFITEACEYVESFLKFYPFIGVILNIDEDHLDYFKDLNHIKEAFRKFAALIPKEGFLVVNGDDGNVQEILHSIECNIITYGLDRSHTFSARDISFTNEGYPIFTVDFNGEAMGTFELNIPGKHNIYNALASIATTYLLGVEPSEIKNHIKRFKGIHRRFDVLGETKGCKIVDDYAHHPVEISATLEAAKNYPHNEIWCVFQPHTFSRTKALLADFSRSFKNADHIIITDIYAAREQDTGEVHSEILTQMIQEHNGHSDVHYMKDFEEIAAHIYDHMKPGDLVLTMGAGNVYQIGQKILQHSIQS